MCSEIACDHGDHKATCARLRVSGGTPTLAPMKQSRAVPFLAGLCALMLGLQSSLAADLTCTSLLQGRVLDLRDTRSFESRVAHFRDVICQREYADIADYRRL